MPALHSKKNLILPLLFILLFQLMPPAYAQDTKGGMVSIHVDDLVAAVANEELKDVTIRITNKGNTAFNGTLYLSCSKGAKIATKQNVSIKLAAGKTLFVTAKVYVGATTLAGTISCNAQLKDEQQNLVSSYEAILELVPNKLMKAQIMETEIVLPHTGTPLRIPVLVSNRGNTPQEINMVLAYPAALQDKTNKSIKIKVAAFRDTLIYFDRKVTKDMQHLEYMDVSIYGVYSNGDYFSIASASVQSAKSRKKFGYRKLNNLGQGSANYVTVGTQNTFSDNESYYVQTKGTYAIPNGDVSFSLNIFKWKDPNLPVLVNDTWLGLEHKGFGIKLGNITQSGELSYNGRGIEMYYYTDSAKQKKIYTGYIDKSFNLVNNGGSASFGKAAWLGYSQEKGRLSNNTMVSYDEDRYAGARSMMVMNNATWRIKELLYASGKVGLANSTSMVDNAENHQSMSIGASINGSLSKKIYISSDNLYSTGYYPGTRRGTLAFNERVNVRLGQTILSGGYMYNYINPKYFNRGGTFFSNDNAATTAELSLSRTLAGINVAITPQYYNEKGNWYTGATTLRGIMTAYRISTSLAYASIETKQNVMLRLDAGQYTTDFASGYQWQFRGNLSYSYHIFRLTAHVQKGSFYLSEAFQEYTGGRSGLRLNISPSLNGSFFNNNLKAGAGVTYYKDFFVSSLMYNANVNYNLGTTRIFATLQYNTFASSSSYRNIQFGLTQMLPQSRKEEIKNKGLLELFVYHDCNSNGIYDQGDSVAKGYLAFIDKTLLNTDKEGMIQYSHLPAANYKIYFPTQKGWYGPDQFISLKNKEKVRVTIPLRQTGIVSGKITYAYDELLSYETRRELSGQSVIATNTEGNTFEAKTDDNGQYVLYLPMGTYSLIVRDLPTQIDVVPDHKYTLPLQVMSGKILNNFDFILKVKQRKIDVKKFNQK